MAAGKSLGFSAARSTQQEILNNGISPAIHSVGRFEAARRRQHRPAALSSVSILYTEIVRFAPAGLVSAAGDLISQAMAGFQRLACRRRVSRSIAGKDFRHAVELVVVIVLLGFVSDLTAADFGTLPAAAGKWLRLA